MIVHKLKNKQYVLRIEAGEELMASLLNFAEKEKINAGFFYGLGATKKCILGRYNDKKKDYDWYKIKKQMEVVSLIGNLTVKEDKKFLHIHVTLADQKLKVLGGHLKELVVYPTCELLFVKIDKRILRKHDNLTNLHLIV